MHKLLLFNWNGKKFLSEIDNDLNTLTKTQLFMIERLCLSQKPSLLQIIDSSSNTLIAYVKCMKENQREFSVYQILKEQTFFNSHIPQLYHQSNSLLFYEAIQPYSLQIKTFQDFLNQKEFDNNQFKSILAQIIVLLCQAFSKDSRFTHNDLKADNILLTATKEEFCHFSFFHKNEEYNLSIKTFDIKVIFIDFETVTGDTINIPISIDKKVLNEFGINEYWCSWTDLHLVFLEIWMRILLLPSEKWNAFIEFSNTCCSYKIIFTSYKHGNKLLTSSNRLSKTGKETINLLIESKQCLQPIQILQLDFFNEIVFFIIK